jgi:ABC-2 type transport system ATP-binding protein
VGAIDLHHVRLAFGTVRAVDDVSLQVRDGEILGLLGHNGAGKTTLMRIINGLLRPDGGTVSVLGRDPFVEGSAVRATTGVLTEYPALDEYLSPAENLAVYAGICGVRRRDAARTIDALLDRLGLADKRDVPARELSAGLKQRVALTRALVHDPRILLLDEPTTNLDPVATRQVRDLIVDASRSRGRTVLLSTHDLTEADELCDRVAIVRRGRLLSLGTPEDLRRTVGGVRGARLTTGRGEATRAAEVLGGRMHAEVRGGEAVLVGPEVAVPEAVAALVRAGVEVHRVEPLEPTLEDLYLHLHADQVEATSPSPAA